MSEAERNAVLIRQLQEATAGWRAQARVYNSAALTITNGGGGDTALTFDSEHYDYGDLHSTAANTSRLTCAVPGLYLITGHVEWAANVTGERDLRMKLNGTTYIGYDTRNAVTTGFETSQPLTAQWRLGAGDYVELCVWQNSGGNLNVVRSANRSPEFSMCWVSP